MQVKPVNGNNDLGEAVGAYVNVAYPAIDKKDFLNIAKESLTSFDFQVVAIEDVEREDSLSIDNAGNAEKLELLKRVKNGDEFAWGTFHTYKE